MPTYDAAEQEVLDTFRAYLETRKRIDAGELPWEALSEYFTDDAYYIDPAWGKVEGRDDIRQFMTESMAGLDDWDFPEEWTMVDGNRVVTMFWNVLPGNYPDGEPHRAPGLSILEYAGDGKFSYEIDLINMAHMNEVIRDSGWKPSSPMNFPPEQPRRY